MKIEIELSELEELRSIINEQATTIFDLEKRLNELDKQALINSATRLANYLFYNYVECLFAKLGLGRDNYSISLHIERLRERLGKQWWEKVDEIDFEIGFEVTNKVKRAILKIDVMPKSFMPDHYELNEDNET